MCLLAQTEAETPKRGVTAPSLRCRRRNVHKIIVRHFCSQNRQSAEAISYSGTQDPVA